MTAQQRDPHDIQVGGNHYLGLAIQPAVFWVRNQLPGIEGAVVKYLTRHASKGRRQDCEKARHFVEMMIWWYFDAPQGERATPQHWRGHRNFVVKPTEYTEQNRLPADEAAAIQLVCDFSCREHLEIVLELIDSIIERDYAVQSLPAPLDGELLLSEVLYVAKHHLEHYLSVLEATVALPEQIARVKRTIARLDAARAAK